MAENEELKTFLMMAKEDTEKAGLKLNIWETKIMGSGSNTWWQKVEIMTYFIFLGSKITVDSYCSHEIQMFTLWKENYDKPRQCIKKQRHYYADKGLCGERANWPRWHIQALSSHLL